VYLRFNTRITHKCFTLSSLRGMTVTRNSVRSTIAAQVSERQGVNVPIQEAIVHEQQQDVVEGKTGRGARHKIGTRRLGEYASEIPRAALTAKLPTKKKVASPKKQVTVDPQNPDILRDSTTNRPLYALMAQRKKNKPLRIVEVGVALDSPNDKDIADDSFDYQPKGPSTRTGRNKPGIAHLHTDRARARSAEERLADDTDENTIPNYRIHRTNSKDSVPRIGNLKTTGLDDESITNRLSPPALIDGGGGLQESMDRVNLKYKEVNQNILPTLAEPFEGLNMGSDYRQKGSPRRSRSSKDDITDRSNKSRSSIGNGRGNNHIPGERKSSHSQRRTSHNPDGNGDDDGDDSPSSSGEGDRHEVYDGSSIENSSILTEDGTRFREMFDNDPNKFTSSMNIPHWVMWTAGIRRIDHRYVIINTLGLNSLPAFTFIKEDSVIRMSKAIKKSHHIQLSEVELAMIWTAIGIVQMALMNKKPVTATSVKELVTPEELVRAYNINELNKTKNSTMEDIKPPTTVILNNSSWKNWYQQLLGYFKVHPNCTKETSLYYVIREPLSPERIEKLSEEERRAYVMAHDETSAVYLRDRTQVWGILHSQLNGQGAYGHIKPFEANCDATSAMNALRRAYGGASMRNSRLREAYDKIASISYEGNERSFPFSKFIEVLLTNYQTIEDYDARVSDRNKITHLIKRINVRSTQVEMAIHNIQDDMDKNSDIKFDDIWPRIQTAITGSDTSKVKKGISSINTRNTGREKGKGKDRNGKKVRFDNKKTENGVDYSDVTSQFTREQWEALSDKTRAYIQKTRKRLRRSGGTPKKNGKDGRDHNGSGKKNIAALEQLKSYIDEKFSNVSLVGTGGKIKGNHKKDGNTDNSDTESYYDEPQSKKNRKSRRS